MGDARKAALSVLEDYRRKGAWPDRKLGSAAREYGLDERDAALCTRLCYGVLQNLLLLDYTISAYSTMKIKNIQPKALDILRMGLFEIFFMDRIPINATVNEEVTLARVKVNPKAAGFVNALLRKAGTSGLPELPNGNKTEYLSVKYSHPIWLVELFLGQLDEDGTEKLLDASNKPTPVYVHPNRVKCGGDVLREALIRDNIDFEAHPWLPDCFMLWKTGNVESLEAYKNGLMLVQDPAARLAVTAADIEPDETVFDLCAAPGGKSFLAAAYAGKTGRVFAFDINEGKVSHLAFDAKRLGIENIKSATADATVFNPKYECTADVVLCDLPCSGLGVIRKKPEIRYKNAVNIAELPDLQLKILNNAAKYVKPGGRLIYSTCTLNPAENSGVLVRFVKNNPDFACESFSLPGGIDVPNGEITLWPHIHGTDGFYIAKLRKSEEKQL